MSSSVEKSPHSDDDKKRKRSHSPTESPKKEEVGETEPPNKKLKEEDGSEPEEKENEQDKEKESEGKENEKAKEEPEGKEKGNVKEESQPEGKGKERVKEESEPEGKEKDKKKEEDSEPEEKEKEKEAESSGSDDGEDVTGDEGDEIADKQSTFIKALETSFNEQKSQTALRWPNSGDVSTSFFSLCNSIKEACGSSESKQRRVLSQVCDKIIKTVNKDLGGTFLTMKKVEVKINDWRKGGAYGGTMSPIKKQGRPTKKPPTPKPPKKHTGKPKGARSAYIYFSSSYSKEHKTPELSVIQVAKQAAAEWKKMSDEDKRPFQAQAREDKERYENELLLWRNTQHPKRKRSTYTKSPSSSENESEPTSKSKKRGRKPPKERRQRPQKPRNAYTFFMPERIRKHMQDDPDAAVANLAKQVANEWRALTPEQRAPYTKKAAEDKERYQKELEEWEANHSEEGSSTSETDSESSPTITRRPTSSTRPGVDRPNYKEAESEEDEEDDDEDRSDEDEENASSEEEDDRRSESSSSETASPTSSKRFRRQSSEVSPNKPAKPRSAYTFFMPERIHKHMRSGPSCEPVSVLAKKVKAEWLKMKPEDKLPYQKMANEDKLRYEKELKELRKGNSDDEKTKSSSDNPEPDTSNITPPRTARAFFTPERVHVHMEKAPHLTTSEIGKLVDEEWAALSAEEKKPYEEKAVQDQKRYQKELTEAKEKQAEDGANSDNEETKNDKTVDDAENQKSGNVKPAEDKEEDGEEKDNDDEEDSNSDKQAATQPAKRKKPGKAKNAYSFFMPERVSKLLGAEQTPVAELAKAVAAEWKALSAEEKAPYHKMAADDTLRYQRELAEWQKEQGPAKEEDSDDEK